MRWHVALVGVCACNSVYGIGTAKPQLPDAAIDAPGCAGHSFSSPVPLDGSAISSGGESDPTLATPLELWFTRKVADWDIYAARRSSPTALFDTPVPLPSTFNTTFDDVDPAFSGDGLDVVFIRRDVAGTGGHLNEAMRATVDAQLTDPVEIQSLSSTLAYEGIDLSFDGLTIYYCDFDQNLRSRTRPARDQPFGLESNPLATGVTWPTISPDGLELYYRSSDGVHHMLRSDPTAAFDSDMLYVTGDDPDVSPDAMTMVIVSAGLEAMSRVCN